jgi:hypothetical protein
MPWERPRNAAVALLFIDFERPNRLRVNGRASITDNDELLAAFTGAQVVVRVRAERIFPNCPRYIHRLTTTQLSEYVPRVGFSPPEPKWKRMEMFADVFAPRERRLTGCSSASPGRLNLVQTIAVAGLAGIPPRLKPRRSRMNASSDMRPGPNATRASRIEPQ